MKLTDLDPRWIEHEGRRIGFCFISPTKPLWRQTCYAERTPHKVQRQVIETMFEAPHSVQGCNPDCAWTIAGGIASATFETMTVTPSLDGSAGGLWHGHITNGQIVGGI